MKTLFFLVIGFLTGFTAFADNIASAGFNTSGAFQLRMDGGPLQVEQSTNLTTWAAGPNGRGTIVDNSSTNADWRFYRAKSGNEFVSNVVGYVRVAVQPGKMALLASPFQNPLRLDQPSARTAVFGTATPNVQISLMQNGKMTAYTFDDLDNNWTPAIPEIPAGTAFFLRYNGAQPLRVTFSGALPQGNLKRNIPQGEGLVGPLVPKPGSIHDAIGAPAIDDAQIGVWNEQTQAYQTSTYEKGANRWVPSLNYKPGYGVLVKFPQPVFEATFNPTK